MEKSRLLSFAAPVLKYSLLTEYTKQRIGIDAESFILAIFNSLLPEFIFLDPNSKIKEMFAEYVDYILSIDIEPFFVFSGAVLPFKQERVQLEKSKRNELRQQAEELKSSNHLNNAYDILRLSFEISDELRQDIRTFLNSKGIQCITAPFEALAELAYLNNNGYIDAVYTNNAQAILYNPNLIIMEFPFISDGSNNDIIQLVPNDIFKFYDISKDRFAQMCCLAGECYSLPVMNWNFKLLQTMYRSKTPFDKIVETMREWLPDLPPDYEAQVIREVKAIFHQYVYDPNTDTLTTLVKCKEPVPSNFSKDEIMKIVRCQSKPSVVKELLSSPFNLQWNSSAEVSPKKKPTRKHSPSASLGMNSILSFFQQKVTD